ncbi:MAG TPA: glycosyltransferase [Thermoanaerobaculia bacterium]|nr:glycosyltransferase [Thermoanaerobaculia bacterium]
MKIAILGTRGVPPTYGGFETFAAELGVRLVARGHEVVVYSREIENNGGRVPRREELWHGIHRVVLPAFGGKYFETVSHALISAIDALGRDFDAVLVCNAANAFVIPLLRAARIPVAINVDGIERKRRKWNIAGRAVYTIGEAVSAGFANEVVADAEVIARYYARHYGVRTVTIPYGADFPEEEDSDVLARLGLTARNYILYVSRFEPENNPLEVVEAYERIADCGLRIEEGTRAHAVPQSSILNPQSARPTLVMLGKGLYAADLVRRLHAHRNDQVLFPGALYGRDYRTLQRNALLYIQATEVGGTHPALIEAMASGGCVLAHDTPENREVGGDAVGYFTLRPDTLAGTLREWLSNPRLREDFRARARKRARERYSWEKVTEEYEGMLGRLRAEG